MKIDELLSRWKPTDVEKLGRILQVGGKVDKKAQPEFALNEGRIDLRGVQLASRGAHTPGISVGASFAPSYANQNKVQSAHFDSVDLSHGNLSGRWIQDSTFADVVFIKTNLEGVTVQAGRFVNCLFDRTNFNGAGIGYRRTRYEKCNFKKVNFSTTAFACAEFDDCVFDDCRLNNVDFFGSSFERCSFVGKVHDVWFRGHYPSAPDKPFVFEDSIKQFGEARPNRMTDVDLSRASISWITFSDDCDLSTCRIPRDDFVMKFSKWEQVIKAVNSRIPCMFGPNDGKVAQNVKIFEAHAKAGQKWYIVNFRDFSKYLSPITVERLKDLYVEEAKRIGALVI